MECNCDLCRHAAYDSREYFVDIAEIPRNRHAGVSGILRVRNDAEFIGECIDSCIGALDELVIVYNDCSDRSPALIEEKRSQYPDKIRVYEYKPPILGNNLTGEEYARAKRLPPDSIHLLSNYYNYALSKSTRRYVLKIDADQIYFGERLKEICDAFRNDKKAAIGLSELYSTACVMLSALISKVFPDSRIRIDYKKHFPRYRSCILKLVRNFKIPVSLSGINLVFKDGGRFVTLGKMTGGLNILSPYNGIGDHPVFRVTEKTYFVPFECGEYNTLTSQNHSIIEFLQGIGRKFPVGFTWVHLNGNRCGIYARQLRNFADSPEAFMALDDFVEARFDSFGSRIPEALLAKNFRKTFRILHDGDIGKIPVSEIDKLCFDPESGLSRRGGVPQKTALPLVSVLIPAYNCRDYIREAVDSVLNQSYPHLEIIVCDDRSTDGTYGILEQIRERHPEVRLIRNSRNEGYLTTFNRLLELADGDYISFLDADDYLAPDKIALQVKAFSENSRLGLCGCNYVSISDAGRMINHSEYPASHKDILDEMPRRFCFCGSSVMIRREVRDQIGGYRDFFRGCVAEDIDWVWRIIERYESCNIAYAGYYYRFHRSSLTRKVNFSIKRRHIQDIVRFLARQRAATGTDFLISGNRKEYDDLISGLEEPYKRDKGMLYRKVVVEYAINKNRRLAFMYFRRLKKLEGYSPKTLRTCFMMLCLLYIREPILIKIKRMTGITHLSSHA